MPHALQNETLEGLQDLCGSPKRIVSIIIKKKDIEIEKRLRKNKTG